MVGHTKGLDAKDLRQISQVTIMHYERAARAYWEGTQNHDVGQNHAALLEAIESDPPYTILDLGCGPGRDLSYFQSLGHKAVGLEGSKKFVDMARRHSTCEILHQDFLAMALPEGYFDGVFANASLFHVPRQELPRVLRELSEALKPGGVLFCSNPRGNDEEGWSGDRYSCFHHLGTWRKHVTSTGFAELNHYYRPAGLPRHKQPWLATVWRKV
jgi:SAM-dependent methyltransferase